MQWDGYSVTWYIFQTSIYWYR